jgi:hypothetical protein
MPASAQLVDTIADKLFSRFDAITAEDIFTAGGHNIFENAAGVFLGTSRSGGTSRHYDKEVGVDGLFMPVHASNSCWRTLVRFQDAR